MSDFSFQAIDPDEMILYTWADASPSKLVHTMAEEELLYIEATFELPLPPRSVTQEVVFLDVYVWNHFYMRKRILADSTLSTERGRPWLVVTAGEEATIHQRIQIS